MKYFVVLAMAAFGAGTASVSLANHVDNKNFSDRDPSTEFYICHTPDHRNDRFVFNLFDRGYCNTHIDGHVIFVSNIEAFQDHLVYSKIICMQRRVQCQAPEN